MNVGNSLNTFYMSNSSSFHNPDIMVSSKKMEITEGT